MRELVRSVVPEEERARFLTALAIPPDELWARDGRLPRTAVCVVWSTLTDDHIDPLFGLHFVARQKVETLGIAGYLAMASASGLDAVARVTHYQRLHKSELELVVDEARGVAHVVERPPPGTEPWPRHLAEAILGAIVFFLRRWSSARLTPIAVSFQHAAPACAAAIADIFGCPAEFEAAANTATLPLAELRAPLDTADPQLAFYLEALAEKMLADLPAENAFAAAVRRAVAELLPSGDVTLSRAARRLALGERTVQRRLREAGLSFQSLVDAVRRDASHRLMRDRRLSVEEVAYLLGFSDPRSFRRARLRWNALPDVSRSVLPSSPPVRVRAVRTP